MPMLKRGYGAVRNLRGKSGARFPPSTVLVRGITWYPSRSSAGPVPSPNLTWNRYSHLSAPFWEGFCRALLGFMVSC